MSGAEPALLVLAALAFAAIGSFVCVVIDRLPKQLEEPNEYGELWDTHPWSHVVAGTSRCSDCGTAIKPWQNVPVLAWLVLRGRCSSCGARIPAYHPVVELAAPLLFLAMIATIGWDLTVLPALWLIPAGLAVTAIDLRTRMVPTRVVWPAFFVAVGLGVLVAGVEGEWMMLATAAACSAAFAGPLFVLWFALPSAMGFGDVRLATLLGWTMGLYAGVRPAAGTVLAVLCLVISSGIGLVVGVLALGARGRKAQVPFGPALVAGAFVCIAFASDMLGAYGLFEG